MTVRELFIRPPDAGGAWRVVGVEGRVDQLFHHVDRRGADHPAHPLSTPSSASLFLLTVLLSADLLNPSAFLVHRRPGHILSEAQPADSSMLPAARRT